MNPGTLDELIMLLSTDWFAPYWLRIGLGVDQERKMCLQEQFRDIVRKITSGAKEYWLVNFSDERLTETRDSLNTALNQCQITVETARRINDLVDGRQSTRIDETTSWLVMLISEQMCQDSPPPDFRQREIAEQTLRKLQNIVSRRNAPEVRFEELCLKSQSEWDTFVRGLTPDLPTKLSDFLASIAMVDEFAQLWAAINSELSTRERQELLEYFRVVALSLTGEPLQLPD